MESQQLFVRQPERNDYVARLIHTLKEQLLQMRTFQNVEELQRAPSEFRERYNKRWIGHRLAILHLQREPSARNVGSATSLRPAVEVSAKNSNTSPAT
jgi:integrase-like protein